MAGRPTLGSMYAGEGSRLEKREGPVQKTSGAQHTTLETGPFG